MSINQGAEMQTDLKTVLDAYLEAFRAQDLERCLAFFHDDAAIDFQIGTYRGRKAIEEWHKERFAAGLTMNRVENITQSGDTVTMEAFVSSSRLASWKIKSLGARLSVRFEDGRIKHAKMNARASNPFKMMHSE